MLNNEFNKTIEKLESELERTIIWNKRLQKISIMQIIIVSCLIVSLGINIGVNYVK
jgi:hypothetical protein